MQNSKWWLSRCQASGCGLTVAISVLRNCCTKTDERRHKKRPEKITRDRVDSNGITNDISWAQSFRGGPSCMTLARKASLQVTSDGKAFLCPCMLIHKCDIKYHRRKFRSQTSDNMDRWKAEQGRGREKRKIRRKKSRRERVRRKKTQMREKGRKVAQHCVFPMIWGSGGSKSRLAKAAGAEPAGQMRDEKLHAVVAQSTFPSQNVQNTPGSDHFWKLRCQKVHVVVARSTFPSQNAQNTPGSDHFSKLRCRKGARRCGAKHISKSKCTKHTRSGPLLAVEMSKKCTPLWHEAHFQVKMSKTLGVRTSFGSWDVEKVHAVVARSTFRSQNVKSTRGSDHFWRFRCRKSARCCGAKHISKSKC